MMNTSPIDNHRFNYALITTTQFATLVAACLSPQFRRYGLPVVFVAKAIVNSKDNAFPGTGQLSPPLLRRVVNGCSVAIFSIWAAVQVSRAIQTWSTQRDLLSLGQQVSLFYKPALWSFGYFAYRAVQFHAKYEKRDDWREWPKLPWPLGVSLFG